MPKIVIIGSLDEGEYEVLYPQIFSEEYHTDHEKGYEIACETFYPAIEAADAVIVYAPNGLKRNGHTLRDLRYAISHDKIVYNIGPFPKECCRTCYWGKPSRGMLACHFDYKFRLFITLAIGDVFAACSFGHKRHITDIGAAWSPKLGGKPWEDGIL